MEFEGFMILAVRPFEIGAPGTPEWCSSAFGSWKLEIGSWILDGHSKSGYKIWKLEVTTWKLDLKVGSWIWKLEVG